MDKLNCWEFKKCGRGPFSRRGNHGICPVALEKKLDGIHGGTNAGRACWVVSHTICKGDDQGTFMDKHRDCSSCEFYDYVKSEEGDAFQLTVNLLKKLER